MRLPKIALAAASLAFAFSSTAAQAANCQPGAAGCVLPLPGPTVSVPTSTAVPVGEALVEEAGFNALPFILAALALAALAAYFLFLDDDDDRVTP